MARRASSGDRSGRAAGALGARAGRVLPETERHADRAGPSAVQRDGAVHAAAHRDGDPSGVGARRRRPARAPRRGPRPPAARPARGPPRAASAPRAAARAPRRRSRRSDRPRRRAESRPTRRSALRLRRSPAAPAQASACADVLHPADEATAIANLACQVGAVRGVGNAYPRRRLPFRECWFTLGAEATHRVERRPSYPVASTAKRQSISSVSSRPSPSIRASAAVSSS